MTSMTHEAREITGGVDTHGLTHHAAVIDTVGRHLADREFPWEGATAKFYDRTTGHGRKETRVVQALTVTDLGVDFPHAAQVAKVVRHRTDTKSGKQSRETVYVITDLTSRRASPERIATILRAHRVIENRLHFVRDTAFREDASKIRTGHSPENMATLRSFAINQLRAAGHTNITAALRTTALRPYQRPLGLLRHQLTRADARSKNSAIALPLPAANGPKRMKIIVYF